MILYVMVLVVCGAALLLGERAGIKKEIKIYFLIGAGASVLGLAVNLTGQDASLLTENEQGEMGFYRRDAGERDYEEEIRLKADGIYDGDYAVKVEAQRYSEEELEAIFARAEEETERLFLAENEDMEHIDRDVGLPDYVCDGQIRVRFSLQPANVISQTGALRTENISEDGRLVEVEADFQYGAYHAQHAFYACLYPPERTEEEQLFAQLSEKLSEGNSQKGDFLALPERIGDTKLVWRKPEQKTDYQILLFGVAAVGALAFARVNDRKRAEKQRTDALLEGYPAMVSAMSLLLDAGMTMFGAWERMVKAYQKKKARGGAPGEVYEEMLVTYRQMQDGMGERSAYETFADRVGLSCYRKLITLVVQNLRKGNADLCAQLDRETENALEAQRSLAKVKGEEASTKLLMPMMLNLVVVIVAIVVPAMIGMKI